MAAKQKKPGRMTRRDLSWPLNSLLTRQVEQGREHALKRFWRDSN